MRVLLCAALLAATVLAALPRHPVDDDIRALTASLTIEQKVGQMFQLDIQSFMLPNQMALDTNKLAAYIDKYQFGSLLNSPCSGGAVAGSPTVTPAQWRSLITTAQELFLTHGSNIPMIFGLDTVHGANYVAGAALFPQQLGLAGTFNRTHALLAGAIGGKDTRYCGIPWVFSPILGVMSHQAWPRVYETFGEDPYLISEMGANIITGYQGNGTAAALSQPTKVAACMKHFIAYPVARNGQDKGPVWLPGRELRQIYVPSFQAAVDANVRTAMEAYHALNGVPLGANKEMLTDLLRTEMGFDGMLVTDYNVVTDLKDLHHIAPDYATATFQSINYTSIDMSMNGQSTDFYDNLVALVHSGAIPESRLDESVNRLLQLKKDLNLFAAPMPPNIPNTVGQPADLAAALDACRESIALVKNDGGLLPLPLSGAGRILVAGPSANSLVAQAGGWTLHWQGATSDSEFPYGSTVYQAVQKITAGTSWSVSYSQGVNLDGSYTQQQLNAAVTAASNSDIVILGIGEIAYAEQPGNINNATLYQGMQDLVRAIAATGKPIALLLIEGRPRVLNGVAELAKSVLWMGLQGPQGGQAAAEILFGVTNPSGRLPFTYPLATNDIPLQYWHVPSTAGTETQWDFGWGMSYTTFTYSNLQLSSQTVRPGQDLNISVQLSNTGAMAGREAVLLFLSDEYRLPTPEVKLLKRFDKFMLQPKQTITVQFTLKTADLTFIGLDEQPTLQAGWFTVAIASQSARFQLVLPPLSERRAHRALQP